MVHEQLRYGKPSELDESIFDHPFQWGSKRTGPDLARVGGKYPDLWHFRHMRDPRDVIEQSLMPKYPWLLERKLDFSKLAKKVSVMSTLGVPYSDEMKQNSVAMAEAQAKMIAENLRSQGEASATEDKEIIALIAYLQRLGKTKEAK